MNLQLVKTDKVALDFFGVPSMRLRAGGLVFKESRREISHLMMPNYMDEEA